MKRHSQSTLHRSVSVCSLDAEVAIAELQIVLEKWEGSRGVLGNTSSEVCLADVLPTRVALTVRPANLPSPSRREYQK